MARNERKRQQKLAKRKAKRKKVRQENRSIAARMIDRLSETAQMQRAVHAPIYECWAPKELFETGMGTVVISRKLADGHIGASTLLLDVYCLGVKNAFFRLASEVEYEHFLRQIRGNESLAEISPACARKLVDEAEAYARDLGFAPHPDYRLARQIFGDIDASECQERFVFGKDGKPFFVQGPHETPNQIKKILATLTKRCGPDGFEYLAVMGGFFDDDDFDDDDFDDDDFDDDDFDDDVEDEEYEEEYEEEYDDDGEEPEKK